MKQIEVKYQSRRLAPGRAVGVLAYWLGWPFWYVALRNTRRVRVLVAHGEHILLERSFIGSRAWGLPGGGMRADESPLAAAQRELHEETGIRVPENEVRLLGDEQVADGGIRYHAYYAIVEVNESTVQKALPRLEVAELCWVHREQLEMYRVAASVRAALRLWASR